MVIRALVGDWELWVTEPTAQPLRGFQSDFDFVSMVPYQASRSRQDLSKVNTLLLGGGMISSELRQHLASSLNTSVYQSYGMTETLSHVALRKLGGDAVNPPYRALPGVSFARDSRACLIIDAPDREVKGLVTNDLVELVDTQSFYYLGRYDNVINSGGWKLHPEQLESQLQSFASNLALVGLPDPLWGEKMVLVVERERPLTKVEQEVLVEKLKGPERPKAFYVIPHFPYTSNGKLQRGRLRQLIQDQKSKTANN